jgi:hypothetical protein
MAMQLRDRTRAYVATWREKLDAVLCEREDDARKGSAWFSVLRRKDSYGPRVGLLARRVRIEYSLLASPSPALRAEWYSKRDALTHSGGTAPDLHRTSLLCPS